jgi:hypothetical protein
LPLRPTVHNAVLPAVTPDSATDFLGLNGVAGSIMVFSSSILASAAHGPAWSLPVQSVNASPLGGREHGVTNPLQSSALPLVNSVSSFCS